MNEWKRDIGQKRQFFIAPFHLTCTRLPITNPFEPFSKILVQIVRVPKLLDGAKILPESLNHWVGCNNVTDDKQTEDRRTDGQTTDRRTDGSCQGERNVGVKTKQDYFVNIGLV